FLDVDQPHPLGISADHPNVGDAQADDLAGARDHHQVVLVGYLLHADDASGAVGRLHRDDPFAAARLDSILRHVGSFAVAVLPNGQDAGARAQDLEAHDPVVGSQRDAFYTAGAAAHAAHLFLAETNRLPVARSQDHFLLAVGQPDADDLVVAVEPDRDDPGRTRIGVRHEVGFFDHS